MTRRLHPFAWGCMLCLTGYCALVTAWLIWLGRAWLFPSLWPAMVVALSVPPLSLSLTVTVFVCARVARRILAQPVDPQGGAGRGENPSVFFAKHSPEPTLHSRAQWDTSYILLCRVASQHGGSLSIRKVAPHIAARPRLYWEWMVAGEMVRAGLVRRGGRNTYTLDNWRGAESRIRRGLVSMAPYPKMPPPVIAVYLRPASTVAQSAQSAQSGAVIVSPGEIVFRGVAG